MATSAAALLQLFLLWCPCTASAAAANRGAGPAAATAQAGVHRGGAAAGPSPFKPYPIPSSCAFVQPSATGGRNINRAYGHYFCRPQGTPTGQLFVFLPGTGTNDYTAIVKTAASVG